MPSGDECRRWAPLVARYSFQTGLPVAPARAPSARD